jgi:uncharacterized protein YlxW (UPF0749 family)
MTSLKRFQWAFILVGLVLGLMLALQFRVTRDIQQTDVIRRAQDLTGQVAQMKRERDALQNQVTELRSQMEQMSAGPQGIQLKQEMDQAGVLAGVTELTGPGVEVTLNDSSVSLKPGENPNLYVLHDEDVLRVLN